MEKYQNIINMPYVKSKKRHHMSNHDRASQFAPFAALNGYEEELIESSRTTSKKIELLQSDKDIISAKLMFIMVNKLEEEILFTYFIKDLKKSGGRYESIKRVVKKIDEVNKVIYFTDKSNINIEDVIDISSKTLNSYFY